MRLPSNLRINADDFGLTPAVSRAILEAAEAGLINSASVVPFRDDECLALLRALAQVPGVRIGAHLTFIEVPLLTRPRAFPDGHPPRDYRDLLRAAVAGALRRREIEAEWSAQLELLSSRLGSEPIHHLDSHQHVHMLPVLWEVAARLKQRWGAAVLRCPYEASLSAWRRQLPMGAGLQLLSVLRTRRAEETFFGASTSMAFSARAYRRAARRVIDEPERAFELMVHPRDGSAGARELGELRSFVATLQELRASTAGASSKPA